MQSRLSLFTFHLTLPRPATPYIRSLTTKILMASETIRSATPASKLIFAPGSDSSTHQASQFKKGALERSHLDSDPLVQFHAWFKSARDLPVPQAEACTLATAELPSGRVSARVVYLKELDTGFVVYSNWGTSRKAADLASNKNVALTFWWREMERQVRIEGTAERIGTDEAQAYFDTRIRGSRIGAWASEQSKVLGDRIELDRRVEDVEKRFEGEDNIPVPDFWGGIRVRPESVEFWQGRDSRLHDRFRYVRGGEGENGWKVERLSP